MSSRQTVVPIALAQEPTLQCATTVITQTSKEYKATSRLSTIQVESSALRVDAAQVAVALAQVEADSVQELAGADRAEVQWRPRRAGRRNLCAGRTEARML